MSAPPIDRPSADSPADSAHAGRPTTATDADDERAHLRERISELEEALDRKEAALDRKDAEIDAVRCRYEALLEDAPAGSEHSGATGLLSRFL